MNRFKMLTLGALMGAAVLSVAASTPVPTAQTASAHAAACPECFPIPPVCEPTEPCPEAGKGH